eukprot:2614518-Rhodomonas_salina.1
MPPPTTTTSTTATSSSGSTTTCSLSSVLPLSFSKALVSEAGGVTDDVVVATSVPWKTVSPTCFLQEGKDHNDEGDDEGFVVMESGMRKKKRTRGEGDVVVQGGGPKPWKLSFACSDGDGCD